METNIQWCLYEIRNSYKFDIRCISKALQSNAPAAGAKPALSWYPFTLYTFDQSKFLDAMNLHKNILTWSILSNISKPAQNQRRSPPSIERGLKHLK